MTRMLVTGATGKTGKRVVDALLARGFNVRAAVRDVERARSVLPSAAELVRLDFSDPQSVAPALTDVDRAYLLLPFEPGFDAHANTAVSAAKAAGVSFILKLSAAGANPSSDFELARLHGVSDQIVSESGMDYAILRPSFFMDNLINFGGPTIKTDRTWYGASKGGRVAWVSTFDLAEVAAEVLARPEAFNGRTLDLTGPEALAEAQLAEMLTERLKRTVRYTDLDGQAYRQGLVDAGTGDFYVNAFVGLEAVKAQGWASAVSPHIEEVLGRKPETFEAFLDRQSEQLAGLA